MADDKSGRVKKAHDERRRQRERELREALERGGEPMPEDLVTDVEVDGIDEFLLEDTEADADADD